MESHAPRGGRPEERPVILRTRWSRVAHRLRTFVYDLQTLVRKPFVLRYDVEGEPRREVTNVAELAAALGLLGTIGGLIMLIGDYDRGLGTIAVTAASGLCLVFGVRNIDTKR